MHVLLHLHCNSGNKITQKDLANHFEVKHSTMAGILSRLSEKNLIEITVDEENKKFKNITLTNKAMEKIELMTSQRDETESILLKGFSSDETTRLRAYLERLYSNLVSGTDISEPVSYTHLDVYKRQGIYYTGKIRRGRHIYLTCIFH